MRRAFSYSLGLYSRTFSQLTPSFSINSSFITERNIMTMDSKSCVRIDRSIISSGFLDSFDYVLTDCDGVLWNEAAPIPGAVETIHALKNKGKHILYVTNNSTKTREGYLEKCKSLGFPATIEDIISTPYCTALYLKSKNFQRKVYIFGSAAISKELSNVGITALPSGPDPVPEDWRKWLDDLKLDPEVGAVIIGFDVHISFPKLTKAGSYLRDPDILFIATNRDEYCDKNELRIPCSGAFVGAVELVTGRTATVIGKPGTYMLDCVKHNYPDIDFSRCIMIGDRLNTDILFGTSHGIRTLLVLTGVNTLEDVHQIEKSTDKSDRFLVPDYYLPSLGGLQEFL